MRKDGKLDYLEMQAGDGTIDGVKSFYSAAFGWSFTDYRPPLFGLFGGNRRRLRRLRRAGR